jgi:hypothetical protein
MPVFYIFRLISRFYTGWSPGLGLRVFILQADPVFFSRSLGGRFFYPNSTVFHFHFRLELRPFYNSIFISGSLFFASYPVGA